MKCGLSVTFAHVSILENLISSQLPQGLLTLLAPTRARQTTQRAPPRCAFKQRKPASRIISSCEQHFKLIGPWPIVVVCVTLCLRRPSTAHQGVVLAAQAAAGESAAAAAESSAPTHRCSWRGVCRSDRHSCDAAGKGSPLSKNLFRAETCSLQLERRRHHSGCTQQRLHDTHTHTHIHTQAHIYIYLHIFMHTYIHTYMYRPALLRISPSKYGGLQ